MGLQLERAEVADAEVLAATSARTVDGGVLSIVFGRLTARSLSDDADVAPQTLRAEIVVHGRGSGWVSVEVRGAGLSDRPHGYAHATGWANGRRLRLLTGSDGEPAAAAVSAPVGADGVLRVSLLLLAQRDLAVTPSAAQCWVDTIDVRVIDAPQRRAA
jgi:hypothetical protein